MKIFDGAEKVRNSAVDYVNSGVSLAKAGVCVCPYQFPSWSDV